MFCQNCNAPFQDNADFCNNCGMKRQAKNELMMLGIFGAILLIIGVIGYLYLDDIKGEAEYIWSKLGTEEYADKVDMMMIMAVIAIIVGLIMLIAEIVKYYTRNQATLNRMYQGSVLNDQMLKCSSCNCYTSKESKFCARCGFDIYTEKLKKCKKCGNVIKEKFCNKCGSSEIEN